MPLSSPISWRLWAQYALSLGAVAAALGLQWALHSLPGKHVPFIIVGAVLVVLVMLVRPGPFFAGAVGGLVGSWYFFLPPRFSFRIEGRADALYVALFGLGLCAAAVATFLSSRARDRDRKTRDVLYATFASSGDAVITTDTRARVTFMNWVAAELTGWRPQEAQGVPLPEVFRIVDVQTAVSIEHPFRNFPETGEIEGLPRHSVIVRRDGTELPIDSFAAPIRYDGEKLAGTVLVFRDVSERSKAENLLRRSERELSDFFENANVALHWVGPDGIILRANEAELAMLGCTAEEYVGHQIAEFHVDQPVIDDILARLTQGETLENYPARLRCKDGSIRDVLISSSVMFENGQFLHTRCVTQDITELKRAEMAQASLAAIVESSDDAIVSKSTEGIIQSWNAAAERIFGYSAREAIGQPIYLIIPPDRTAEEGEILSRIRSGQRVEHFESVRVTKDGRHVPVSLTISPVKDRAGRVIGASKIARDITARKQAQEALRESEERFRVLADSAPALIWVNGLDGCEFVNRAYLEFIGAQPADVRNYDWAQFLHPADRESYVNAYLRAFSERAVFEAQHRFRRADGEYRWMKSAGMPRFGAAGEFQGYVGSTLDITDIKEAEAALRESEARFRNMADHAPVMIWVTEADQRCIYLNKNWYELTGQTPEDGLGCGRLDAVHPDDRERVERDFNAANTSRESVRLDYRLRQKESGYRWVIDSAAPRISASGEFRGYIGSVIDITERRQMEEALREADTRKDEFLAMLGHELRNPLAAISTGTALLQSSPEPERRAWIEQMISRQVSQLQRLVDDLVDVARITRGKIELRKESVLLRKVIDASAAAVEDLMTQHGHRLVVSAPSHDILLNADPARLEQILGNLLTNAAKYTPDGGTVWLSAEPGENEVLIRCRDTGRGLSGETLESIFEPFVQFASMDGRPGDGLGMGLTLVKKLTEMHGGSIAATSAGLGKGSEFILRLPAPAVSARDSGPVCAEPAGTALREQGQRILVVDDNNDLAESLALYLRDAGHQVTVAHDGAKAISIAADLRPEIVLLDIGLPGMDGFAVAERLRAMPDLAQARIIAISGYNISEEEQVARVEFDQYLIKPIVREHLADLLQDRVANRKGA